MRIKPPDADDVEPNVGSEADVTIDAEADIDIDVDTIEQSNDNIEQPASDSMLLQMPENIVVDQPSSNVNVNDLLLSNDSGDDQQVVIVLFIQ